MSDPRNPLGGRPRVHDDPWLDAFAITPGTATLARMARGLWIGGAGNVVVVTQQDSEVTFYGATAGSFIPVVAKKVLATSNDSPAVSTTATFIVGGV
jgi:hypothetical protein